MRERQAQARNATDGLAFASWLRRGIVPEDVIAMARAVEAGPPEVKFNPYHDPANGRFTFGGLPRSASYTGMTAEGPRVIKPTSGGGFDRNGRPVPEQFPPDPYALTNPASALAHYMGGSGEDRNYYFNNVDTSQVRLSDFPEIMKLADNAKPGVYPIVDAKAAYNGNFTGLSDTSPWATVGGLKLRANGALAISKDGQYRFNGVLSAVPDKYDFDIRKGRSSIADALTAVGRAIPGKKFLVYMIGSKRYTSKGASMRPWQVFKRGIGCASLFVTLVAGFVVGYCLCWFEDTTTPYIDRQTAIRYGLENARGHCAETDHIRPVDCVHFRLTEVQEDPAGWFLTFATLNGRRTDSMIIRRKGEYDSTGETDLDNPNWLKEVAAEAKSDEGNGAVR